MLAAILYEDGKPIRAFKDDKCLFNAFKWAHHHFCLEDEGLLMHQLPEWLEVKLIMLTEEEFNRLVE